MNSTDLTPSQRLSAELFDRYVVPLAKVRWTRGEPAYFQPGPKENQESYFSRPATASMAAADFERSVFSTPEQLIDGLTAFWEDSGEADLCSLVPMMRKIASALQEEAAEHDGSVSVFCYAMF
jgi:alkanesulfonate monooxygenase SsuD/methylene tetrahydromethanopterin reductase-like flavin-dependent oxidoreductase (luciferase family)